jgi:transcriptional regulator with XRE-family HTH domain
MIAELEARRERRRPALLPAPDQRKSIRVAYGVSQKDVADVLGVSRLTISMWERGQTEPKAEHAQKYAELLHSMSEAPTPKESES